MFGPITKAALVWRYVLIAATFQSPDTLIEKQNFVLRVPFLSVRRVHLVHLRESWRANLREVNCLLGLPELNIFVVGQLIGALVSESFLVKNL